MTPGRTRIGLVISSLACGGAERVLSRLANYWDSHGFNVRIFVRGHGEVFFPLNKGVSVVHLPGLGGHKNPFAFVPRNVSRIRNLRVALREFRPKAVVSFLVENNLASIVACSGLAIPLIISERSAPTRIPSGWFGRLLRRLTYPYATLVVQTEASRRYFRNWVPSVTVIPNPVGSEFLNPVRTEPSAKRVICVARLHALKGIDLLVEAFHLIATRFPQWSLEIWGDGPERERLTTRILELGLTDRVFLKGFTKNVPEALGRGVVFVLPSRCEGFPNALCEAMAMGRACVAFDCPDGPGEIIRAGVNGLLVKAESVMGLAEALSRVMSDGAFRESIAKEARKLAEELSEKAVFSKWDAVLERVLGTAR